METSELNATERQHQAVYKGFITFMKLSAVAVVVGLALLAITLL
jgi:hypothetical protein